MSLRDAAAALLRRVRRPVHARVAHRRDRRAHRGVRRREGRPGLPGRVRRACCALRRPPLAADRGAAVRRARRRRADLPQARGPQPHRLAQDQQRASARRCSPSAWARPASSPRPAPASTASPRRPPRPCSASTARSTWARTTPAPGAQRRPHAAARRRGRARSRPARAPSRTPSTRRSATGWPASRRPTTSSAASSGPHPFPVMVRDFQKIIGEEARAQLLDADRHACPTRSSPASAAARTRSACSTRSSTTPTVKLFGVEAAGDGVDTAPPRGVDRPRPPRRAARRSATSCRTTTARRSSRTRSRPASTTPASAPSTRGCRPSAAPSTSRVTDAEALEALRLLCRTEGIIPALESAHALAGALRLGRELGPDAVIARLPLRPRRQGHGHRGPLVRPVRRRGPAPVVRRPPTTRPPAKGSNCDLSRRRGHRRRQAQGRGAFVGYLPLGFPDLQTSIDAAVALAESGADVLELGPPYSDPVMDGTGHPGSHPGGARRRLPDARHFDGGARDHRPRRRAGARDDVLEPGDAVRRRPLRRGPARGRRRRADHARHHARVARPTGSRHPSARGLDRVFLAAPSSTDERLDLIVGVLDRLRLHRLDDGHHGGRAIWMPPPARSSQRLLDRGYEPRVRRDRHLDPEQVAGCAGLRRRRDRRHGTGAGPRDGGLDALAATTRALTAGAAAN